MRTLAILSCLSVLAACGSSGSSSSSNTVGGRDFTVVGASAVKASSTTPCQLVLDPTANPPTPVPIGVTGLKIDLTSYANACTDYDTTACVAHQNAQAVTILLAKLNPPDPAEQVPTAPAIPAGTYTLQNSPSIAIPDGNGFLTVGFAAATATNAACGGTPSPAVTGSTIRLDDSSGATITGHVDMAFADGSRMRGDFSAPTCPGFAPDICKLAETTQFCDIALAPQCR